MSHARSACAAVVSLLVLVGCGSDESSSATCAAGTGGAAPSPPAGLYGPLPAACGNGVVDEGELCDYLLDCPQSCPATDACQLPTLQGSPEHCDAQCTYAPVTACVAGDGCCPDGCTGADDADCPTYYVDAESGDDGNPGTSPAQAWKSVAKINASGLAPGDRVGFKRGQVWREALIVSASGTASAPITYSSYGSGDKAVLRLSTLIEGWQPSTATSCCANLWAAPVGFPLRQLFVDGQFVTVAHDPNGGYYTIDNPPDQPSTSALIDNELVVPGHDLAGANVCLRTVQWDLEERQAVDYDADSGTITLASPTSFAINGGWGYYLENKLWMLDQPNEWLYDPASATVYYCAAPGDQPSAHRIEGSRNTPCLEGSIYSAECGILARGQSNVVISDLAVEQAGGLGVWVHESEHFHLVRLDVRSTGGGGIADEDRVLGRGIVVSSSPSSAADPSTVELCRVEDNVRDGIAVFDSPNAHVARNVIRRNGVVGMPRKATAGLWISDSAGALAAENRIDHSGYVGIIYGPLDITLQHNFVNYSCLVLDDCGATYTSGEHNAETPFQGSVVRENILLNSVGNSQGTPQPSSSNGIYFDFSSRGHEVVGNTVARTAAGITFGDASECTVTGNTLYDNQVQLQFLEYAYDQAQAAGYSHGHTITSNAFFSRVEQQFNLMLHSDFDTPNPGVFTGNSYDNPYDASRIYRFRWVDGVRQDHQLGVGQWRRLPTGDATATSADGLYQVSAGTATGLGPELAVGGTFDQGLGDWWAWPTSVPQTWVSSCPGMDGGCLQATTTLDDGSEGLAITPQIPELVAGPTYVLAFSISATIETFISVYAYGGDDGERWDGTRVPIGPTRRDFRLFAVMAAGGPTTIQFSGIPEAGVTVSLDNVSLRVAESATPNDRSDDSRLLWNASAAPRDVDIGTEQWCDVTGEPLASPLTLPAFGSQILLACFCNRDGACNNHETAQTCPADCAGP
jgi:parallel beta-helix repeat protein